MSTAANSPPDRADTGADAEGSQPLKLFEAPAATLDDPPVARTETAGRHCEERLAPELHPRERLLSAGPGALSASELLAVVLGGDAWRALRLAGQIISTAGGLAGLRAASYHDLASPGGASPGAPLLTEARACAVLAAGELGRRMASARGPEPPVVSSPADVHELLVDRLRDLDREHFVVVLLDTKNRVIGSETVSVGTLSSSVVHPREVFKPAIKASAANVILAHNHPTGHLEPSPEDRRVTKRLAEAGETIGIGVLDHVVIGEGYASLKERGLL